MGLLGGHDVMARWQNDVVHDAVVTAVVCVESIVTDSAALNGALFSALVGAAEESNSLRSSLISLSPRIAISDRRGVMIGLDVGDW